MAKITWEINDGYCGKSRPQHIEVPDEELMNCNSELEMEELVIEYVDQDFMEWITPYVCTDLTELWKKIEEEKKKEKKKEEKSQ